MQKRVPVRYDVCRAHVSSKREKFSTAAQKASSKHRLRMNGQLAEHPLVELINEIGNAQISGALRLEQERVKAVVYFEAGEIVYAASNLRAHRLREIALRAGVTEQQLAQVSGEALASDAKLGAALVEAKVLSTETLEKLLRRQAADVLRPLLLWTNGAWRFEARARLVENMRLNINSRELLLEAARRLPEDFAATRFRHSNEMLFPEPAAAFDELEYLPTEAFMLSRLDAPTRLYEIIAISGLPEPESLRIIYALAVAGCVRRENPARAFTPEEIAHSLALQTELAAAKQSAAAAVAATNAVSSPTTSKSDSNATAKPVPLTEEDEQRALDEMFARLERATDYYTVLGISRRAPPDEVKRAYHAHARRYHPDRFHSDADKALHTRIEAIFTRIAQAYETLRNKTTRATYDLKLSMESTAALKPTISFGQQTSPAQQNTGGNNQNTKAHTHTEKDATKKNAPPSFNPAGQASSGAPVSSTLSQAENYFQQGLAAGRQGNKVLATARFGEAARIEPQQPRYRAQYGQALAANPQTRPRAEAELKAAVELDKGNVSYRVMLAEFYRSIGLQRRAETELEQALALDPRNENTRRLLNSVRAAAKTTLRQ